MVGMSSHTTVRLTHHAVIWHLTRTSAHASTLYPDKPVIHKAFWRHSHRVNCTVSRKLYPKLDRGIRVERRFLQKRRITYTSCLINGLSAYQHRLFRLHSIGGTIPRRTGRKLVNGGTGKGGGEYDLLSSFGAS